jgi:hypothetical protein
MAVVVVGVAEMKALLVMVAITEPEVQFVLFGQAPAA